MREYGQKNWKGIASHVADKTEMQCLHRWTKVIDPDLVKGPWTEEVSRAEQIGVHRPQLGEARGQ